MFMTEGTVEEIGGTGFDILLGLRWWDKKVKTPYWSAIYGGYGYATGMAGHVKAPLADGLCTQVRRQCVCDASPQRFRAEGGLSSSDPFLPPTLFACPRCVHLQLTEQFMVGGTMGWFTYQNYKQTFFDPANDQYVCILYSIYNRTGEVLAMVAD